MGYFASGTIPKFRRISKLAVYQVAHPSIARNLTHIPEGIFVFANSSTVVEQTTHKFENVTAYWYYLFVTPLGFEPRTPALKVLCSKDQLSYEVFPLIKEVGIIVFFCLCFYRFVHLFCKYMQTFSKIHFFIS